MRSGQLSILLVIPPSLLFQFGLRMRRAKDIYDDGPVVDVVEGGRALHRCIDVVLVLIKKFIVNVVLLRPHQRRDNVVGIRGGAKHGR